MSIKINYEHLGKVLQVRSEKGLSVGNIHPKYYKRRTSPEKITEIIFGKSNLKSSEL